MRYGKYDHGLANDAHQFNNALKKIPVHVAMSSILLALLLTVRRLNPIAILELQE